MVSLAPSLKFLYFKSIFHFLSWLLVYIRMSSLDIVKPFSGNPSLERCRKLGRHLFTPLWGSNCAAISIVVRHCNCLSDSILTASCLRSLCSKFNLFVFCSCSLIGFIHTCLMFIILWICSCSLFGFYCWHVSFVQYLSWMSTMDQNIINFIYAGVTCMGEVQNQFMYLLLGLFIENP